MTPRTLSELRAAVARVLLARGEAADSVWVDRDQWGVGIRLRACGCVVEWIYEAHPVLRKAIANAWRQMVSDLSDEHRTATAASLAHRDHAGREAGQERLCKAEAALAVAREIGGGE